MMYYLFESQNYRLPQDILGAAETLDFSEFTLKPLDCAVLSHVLQLCNTIKNLNLNSCNIGAEGIQHLVPALHKCQHLRLGSNNLGDCGVKRHYEALRNPECKMQSLRLDSNSLTDGCTDDLVSALMTSRSLRDLKLESNSFTDGSVPALRCLIQTCTSLEEIWLYGNRFSAEEKNQLESLRGIRAELTVTV
eukprot:gi/632985931/ref/XP_007909956.1/ PREDICTED: NACHT, LRR and PYD domains-containing protein 3-like [Callorhinchus milii]